jgi:hypothetical protein
MCLVLFVLGLDVELLHGHDNSFGALDKVFENSWPVIEQLIFRVAFEMDNFHLFDNRRLATLTRTCQIC